jgi:threonine dehydratase
MSDTTLPRANPKATPPIVRGLRCAACGTSVDVRTPLTWRCPNAVGNDRHHVLLIESDVAPLRRGKHANPFIAFRRYLAWDAFASANGMSEPDRDALIEELDGKIATVAGTGFRFTPFARADRLSDALGFSVNGGVWVKDETHNVAGSQKSRHLFTELLHLVAAERLGLAPWATGNRPALAIASCGNAAFAASTLARAVEWPIRVFVPEHADAVLVQRLRDLAADVVHCPRRNDDPPGDPCVHRFREATRDGAIPFGVQGPENAWCLDGGRTIGWEMAYVAEHMEPPLIARLFVQVGGGAFASCVAEGFHAGGTRAALHAVQAAGCAPLAKAWESSTKYRTAVDAAAHWDECMVPWPTTPQSFADGILDDETYDWVSVCRAMRASGGSPIVATEQHVHAAYELAHSTTDIDVSPTGAAGLAGLLAARDRVGNDERVALIFSGVRRETPLPGPRNR